MQSHIADIHTAVPLQAKAQGCSSSEYNDIGEIINNEVFEDNEASEDNEAPEDNEASEDNEKYIGTKPKQYTCRICSNIFVRQCDLENHLKTNHHLKQNANDLYNK